MTQKAATEYQDLEALFGRIGRLGEAAAVLHWDSSTMMPAGGAEARAEQLAALNLAQHEMLTDEATGDLLAAAAGIDMDPWQAANLREMARRRAHATAVEPRLVEAFTKACTATEMVWREARPNDDFKLVLPHLESILALVREVAAAQADALGTTPYDALLDEYEPGGRADRIDPLFDDLAAFLPDFTDRVLARQAAGPDPLPLDGPFDRTAQRALAERFMQALGFDFAHGRLDESLHPFCGGVPDDVRITTRYEDADFTKALMGVLHETGHALYERGLPEGWRGQPVGHARGMSLHESQSLLVEMQVCRSRPFLDYAAPLIRAAFDRDGAAWQPDNLYRHYTRVERGFIRVDADEATYPGHVILRYRLEQAMLAGDLAPADLPGAWAEGMRELVGVTPPDDRRGCLQDIHWYDGAWGYFPTYTLGAMTAAQLYDAARRDVPDLEAAIAAGDFRPLMSWLRRNVHAQASLLDGDALIAQATGRALDPAVFKAHLEKRYLPEG